MDTFTVGDRCLVHSLQSKAGQVINGKHVTLVKKEKHTFLCKCGDDTFYQIKPCNLQSIPMDAFTVGDRCLVHSLETFKSEAGQVLKPVLDGQHVTLVELSNPIPNPSDKNSKHFLCECADGSFKQIKPCNLQRIQQSSQEQMSNNVNAEEWHPEGERANISGRNHIQHPYTQYNNNNNYMSGYNQMNNNQTNQMNQTNLNQMQKNNEQISQMNPIVSMNQMMHPNMTVGFQHGMQPPSLMNVRSDMDSGSTHFNTPPLNTPPAVKESTVANTDVKSKHYISPDGTKKFESKASLERFLNGSKEGSYIPPHQREKTEQSKEREKPTLPAADNKYVQWTIKQISKKIDPANKVLSMIAQGKELTFEQKQQIETFAKRTSRSFEITQLIYKNTTLFRWKGWPAGRMFEHLKTQYTEWTTLRDNFAKYNYNQSEQSAEITKLQIKTANRTEAVKEADRLEDVWGKKN